jgi:putative spermidine/putrescine transport system substrate-binding protein
MSKTKRRAIAINRRALLAAGSAVAVVLAAPRILRAQGKEVVVGGAASHKGFVDNVIAPAFAKKTGAKVVFEGTRSLVNLEKMQKNKDKQYVSVVMMDDPVMIPAVAEGLLEKMTPAKVPAMATLKAGTIHMDGMWVNYLQPLLGIAYNPKVMKTPPASWAEIYDPRYKGRIILPSLQNTEGLANLFMAAHLATGKPMAEAAKDIDAAFKKLVTIKPNLLTAYTQMPQAYNLLEQGEGYMIASAFTQVAIERKNAGAPVDIAAPKEGMFAMPSGVALVKGGPQPELAAAYVNLMLDPELQTKLAAYTTSLPVQKDLAAPAGMPTGVVVHPTDWKFVADNRADWVKRWDRDMAM